MRSFGTRAVQLAIIAGFIGARVWWGTFDGDSEVGGLAIIAVGVLVVALIPLLARWTADRRR